MRIPIGPHVICALLLALALASCGKEAARPSGVSAVPVTTQQVRMQQWNDTVQALGTVKARESVTITAKVTETVRDVHFDSGDLVQAGAPLVTLSGNQQQSALAEAQASAAEADQLYRRMAKLGEQQLVARATLETQRAVRDAAMARVDQIRAQLSDRQIRAPFAGVLGLRQVSPGALVTPGTAIATLDDTQRVYVDFPVPEPALAHLEAGQVLHATSASWPGETFDGVVQLVDSRVDPSTRAVTVRGEFPNDSRMLRPGMLMQVTLVRPQRQALLVPEIAVVQLGNTSFVYRVRADSTVERADVLVGNRRQGMAEVVSGLEPGDEVVVDGTGKLRVGAKVEVTATGEVPVPAQDAPVVEEAPGAAEIEGSTIGPIGGDRAGSATAVEGK
ncbi:efflux RND transporter periplasmic adaptor subunit [Lysobacter ciconiae]|uniref:Efflux RND transporter periplasmic adaptor subunit n=1 Tax=Novilysobacter ciconiae TaxID=2781022 RepID=A0A7S6UH10_9GAMM|nr:efflux RND transporter periplasmic adaptor subunit [Lysobacter ciconiae]